ncbi:hypothetical protein ACOSQ3_022164 [Xanthoceras sorbifolium]
MAKILNLRQQLQTIKKGSHSVSDFVLKIKNIGDALSTAGEEVSERDLLLSLMHGVGHEYDSVVVLISSQRSTMSLEEAQFLLLIHEQRIEELNSPTGFGGPTANYAANSIRGGNSGGYNRHDYSKHKLDFHTTKCVFIGYSLSHKGYCCLHPNGKVFITRHAEFNELEFPYVQLFSSATGSSSSSSVPISTIVDFMDPMQQSSTQQSLSVPTAPSRDSPNSDISSDSSIQNVDVSSLQHTDVGSAQQVVASPSLLNLHPMLKLSLRLSKKHFPVQLGDWLCRMNIQLLFVIRLGPWSRPPPP